MTKNRSPIKSSYEWMKVFPDPSSCLNAPPLLDKSVPKISARSTIDNEISGKSKNELARLEIANTVRSVKNQKI